MIRVVIADDEPLARSRLRALLADHADIEVVAEAEAGDGVLAAIRAERPEVVFLDIQMPGRSGVELARQLHVTPMPFIVFVTAHAHYAVDAFELGAVDYLLKPVDEARLAASLARARSVLALRESPAAFVDRLAVTVGKRTIFLRATQVDWIEADGNYVRLHVGPHSYLLRLTLGELEQQLDRRTFARIHRSYAVRLDFLNELQMTAPGQYRAILASGTALPVSTRYRSRLPRS
ncbi:MAG TPA: LytTR family DNA-binding domain-containing protein [Gemmatimonadaceae bacterium]|jgi:two-component system LytT family response regulator|nr:LytTR family DNA-binding domain-containing protein [Gemmatimonadaceae bacterium]